jgi:MoaA/NifB/PqqE/SkfB family radical SAM enzyme
MPSTSIVDNRWKAVAINSFNKRQEERDPAVPVFGGVKQRFIQGFIWLTILILAFKTFKNPFSAITATRNLKRFRNNFRNGNHLNKLAGVGNRFFFTYNAPGWPSIAFNRYIIHQLKNNNEGIHNNSIHTLLFGITKKCGFKCEHCCEWDNLNKPEILSTDDLLEIVHRFQQLGITQLQLSGGEPLNRFSDILYLLDHAKKGTDFWILTSGYNLNKEKARELKRYGLTGITISLDHCEEDSHDRFRGIPGSFKRALNAAACAHEAGLAICFSICPTQSFISKENLLRYAVLAKEMNASFIQILEPKAVGRYNNQPVTLTGSQIKILEKFYEQMNYTDDSLTQFPIISYHGYYSRRVGCAGSGKDYVYVDTDGDVHSCPFCRHKLFSALDDNLSINIHHLKQKGCGSFNACLKTK